jgi:23S rRNA pseudouridine1911/1915/1917 synthase
MLETGRTHQIRVHMAALGHPLFGDTLYGGKKEIIQRQALHCKQLDFLHPFNHNKPMTFQCEIPKDISFQWQSET